MKRLLGMIGLLFPALLLGCAAFLKTADDIHDKITKLCDVVGEQQHDAIAARSQALGLSFSDVYQAWHKTCEANALLGTTRSVGAIGDVHP